MVTCQIHRQLLYTRLPTEEKTVRTTVGAGRSSRAGEYYKNSLDRESWKRSGTKWLRPVKTVKDPDLQQNSVWQKTPTAGK